MKILFVLESYYPNIGGVETLFKSLAEALSHRNHQVRIITVHPGGGVPVEEKSGNITIRRYHFFNRYFFTLFAFIPVLFNAGKYDLIHTTSYNAGIPAFLGAWFNRKRTIITFHEYWGRLWFELPYFSRLSLWIHYLFERFLIRIPFDKLIAVSGSTRSNLIAGGVSPARVEMIYNGIDYSEWIPEKVTSKEPVFKFVYFGRLGISKGIDQLLEAARLLAKERSGFKLMMIIPRTPRSLFARVEDFIDLNELHNQVQLSKHLAKSELVTEVCSADAVVIPSYSEGFCYSAVESVALGRPMITSGRGALSEVVAGKYITLDRLDGISLCQAMKDAMDGLWKEKEIRYFPLQDTIDRYLNLYEQMLKT